MSFRDIRDAIGERGLRCDSIAIRCDDCPHPGCTRSIWLDNVKHSFLLPFIDSPFEVDIKGTLAGGK